MNKNEAESLSEKVSSGVEALIQRLQDDGVKLGREQAKKIIEEANAQAELILDQATEKAKLLVSQAEQEAGKIRKGGEDALKIAARDIELKLKAKLSETVGDRVKRLINSELKKEDFIQELIIEIASRARKDAALDKEKSITILLPSELIGLEELREHPLELSEGSLSHFVLNVAADVLREGVSFAQSEDGKQGLRIILNEKDIQIDLSDERISEILLEHLQPRFRAILEGAVK